LFGFQWVQARREQELKKQNSDFSKQRLRLLVTGGAGFIGSNLVDTLVSMGHIVTVIDNESAECNEKFYWNNDAKGYKYDISDYAKIRPLFDKIDCVFHLAAESRMQPAILNPLQTIKTNVLGTATVLQCAKEAGVDRVIYSTTSSYYGKKNILPNVETQIEDCLNAYSVSKVSGEKLCKMYNDLYGLKTISLRYFNVYGHREPTVGQYAPVIGLFLKQSKEGDNITVVGNGLQKRDFTNVKDVVSANIIAATKDLPCDAFGEAYNIGSGVNHSIYDIASMIDRSKIIFVAPRIGEAEATLADISKAKSILGWEPKVSLTEYLDVVLSY
jgi:UDP-glucose 4-epimerase